MPQNNGWEPVSESGWEPVESTSTPSMVPQTKTKFERDNEGVGRQFVHRMASYLPTVGGTVGGILGVGAGAPTGPGAVVTGVGGAILGGSAGESAKQLIDLCNGIRHA